ncbi:hypothetical protein UlMin_005663 [Ulmus minor]
MGISNIVLGSFSVIYLVFSVANGAPLVPALFIFGDSVVDVGNNNNLATILKANFPPYGRDFVTRKPTGRFCNGKLATDFTAENLGFTTYPPAYLSPEAKGDHLLTGANFASGGSGYYEATSKQNRAISLTQQLNYYKEYQSKLVKMVGQVKANETFSGAIHILSAGNSDFVQKYYIDPILSTKYTPDQFSDLLMKSFSNFIQTLYGMGARRIGVTSLPPIGCLPAAMNIFGLGAKDCVERLNKDAISFNNKLNNTVQGLKQLPGIKLVMFDIYNPLLNLIQKPNEKGFTQSRRSCCGTGLVETAVLCNSISIGTCSNATEYVFWDGFHPSQAANEVLAGDILTQGFALIS